MRDVVLEQYKAEIDDLKEKLQIAEGNSNEGEY